MRVLLVPNIGNTRAVAATVELLTWLASAGYEPLLCDEDAARCGLAGAGVARSAIGEPDLAVALGGDGTILKTVHLLDGAETPVLGVNLGRLGFLSGAKAEDMREAVLAALAGEARVERRATLSAHAVVGGRDAGRHLALNEVHIGRGPSGRAVELSVAVNGVEIWRMLADGVVVATPSGSTAYALSAGGPFVSPDVRCSVLVPVAPHALTTRPFVLGPSDVVEIACPNPGRADACLVLDGESVPCRLPLDRVTVGIGERDVRLVRYDDAGFYGVVRDSFLGG